MANDGQTVRRILHLKFTLPSADSRQLSSIVQASAPFYELFGSKRVHLLQNVDDPARFIQVIEYETHETMELNRQRIAADARIQNFIQAWRAMLPGAIEMDVYEDVTATP
jgi:hypothetical protein